MTRRPEPHDPTAERLLDAAAQVFTERGGTAGMAEVAAAAGVGRATLYRYFPNRAALLRGLVHAASEEVERRIADADIDNVDVREGLSRLCRGFMAAGSRYGFLAAVEDQPEKGPDLHRRLGDPVRALLERGVAEGVLRDDLPVETLFALFTGLLTQAVRLAARDGLGPERAAAAVIALFLDGAALRG
ncbi:TetR/AcrR family transcriptional regulator [Glycomyces sp. A-F 0318]|uniref:TetR/AcrR family transcriptional regulator n=1 Tax=Glycomyces amatae TaxID=2881355 RepID=UPI001E5439B9|nr:TetR/AcrR family transcriptional regulator [Glycomyces amatae]MCD0446606.1 TetR/AcrR family transcriptional regulator [Glycomyces amatae]